MTQPSEYYHRVNQDLLVLLPPDAKVIVEVGCAAGAMAHFYKRINPHGQYLGIEIHSEVAKQAAQRLDRVVVGDAERVEATELGIAEGGVDCLVYGDVLEHLVDPWALLRKHASWLRDGGQVLACLPNVQHGSVLLNLLRGRWDYQDAGLLDRTHLRFFTVRTIEQMFAQAGLRIYDLKTRAFPNPAWDRLRDLFHPILQALGEDPARFAQMTDAFQYIVQACKGPAPKRLLIQTLIGAPLACDRVRVLDPDRFSATIPGVRTHSAEKRAEFSVAEADEEKVIILQRACLRYPDDLEQVRQLLRRDYLVVIEFDDDPLHWENQVQSDLFTFRACHAVQTSTEPLAEFFRQYNPNVAVFANQLTELPPPRGYGDDSPVSLFFGALNRENDWAPLMPALNRVLADYGDRVRVRVMYDRRFFEGLQTDAKEFTPWSPYEVYQQTLGTCDIGLLPLLPTRFNGMKSDLKHLECAGYGAVALASPTVYAGTIRDGETGVLFETPEDFEHHLRGLIDERELRHRIAAAAYDYVAQNRLLYQHYRQRREWYVSLRADLPRLNTELRNRVPELFQ